MPPFRKKLRKEYHFSVEGETEKWYLKRLQQLVNEQSEIQIVITVDSQNNPVKFVKRFKATDSNMIVYHICDMENQNTFNEEKFKETLAHLKEASKLKADVKYRLGYSNISFELWMILHKMDSNKSYTLCSQYLQTVRECFQTSFENLDSYKEERNFKQCLGKLTLNDVRSAIKRAEGIQQNCIDNGYKEREHCGYRYYLENPSLSIHQIVRQILKDANVL